MGDTNTSKPLKDSKMGSKGSEMASAKSIIGQFLTTESTNPKTSYGSKPTTKTKEDKAAAQTPVFERDPAEKKKLFSEAPKVSGVDLSFIKTKEKK